MAITVKDVEHVAKLARLELTEEEKEKFTRQLGDVLKYVDQMNEVDTSNVEPLSHPIEFVNVMRDDVIHYEQTKEQLMANAPDEENGFFKVPNNNYSIFIKWDSKISHFLYKLLERINYHRAGELLVQNIFLLPVDL